MRSFRRLTISTLIAVYVLILVGGIVRSSGSGMGCPDWPKCFGSWVPPASYDELPDNYKEIYATYRHKKNERFAHYLTSLGMDETANAILNDPSIRIENDFNPVKTWIEYVNRVVGVIIGFLIFAVFVFSFRFWKTSRRFTLIAGAAFFLVGFQGWIGSFVVSTNLTPWTITVHMFLALVIVALLVWLVHETDFGTEITSSIGFWWLLACIAVLLVQILLGTQLREAIDRVAGALPRGSWIESIGRPFMLHRSFSWIVVILHVGLIVKLHKTRASKSFALALIVLILGTLLTGLGMAYFGVPPVLQPIHLLLATATFGMQFLFLLKLNRKEEMVTSIES
ncbi:COX15/CtaA family protein [Chryseolinea sp. T2]|uniref:COX15/CtaA family protein n=1 Tax=Chryseolinea sp. T2 TaxID=3129255 RepID=UPI00307863D1